jgi:hypothetical protein
MKKIWINKANSFKKAQEFDLNYYLKMKPEDRLSIIQFLREEYFRMKNEDRKRLRRVIKVIQQK